ncbi:MAG: cellulase family glycosylhydrolase [Flavobacteriaceae bacterium]|nr:cellulase family glycosylhydrolase [Flavobacteriaceae bacterium]
MKISNMTSNSLIVLTFIGIYILTGCSKPAAEILKIVEEQEQPVEKIWPNRLRGINMAKLSANMMQEDLFKQMADWNVSLISLNFGNDEKLRQPEIPEAPEVPENMKPYKNGLYILDKLIQNAKKYKMYVNIQARGAVGSSDIIVSTGETTEENKVHELFYLKNVQELYAYLGEKYKNNPTVLAYNFIAEPHSKYIVENWDTEVVPNFISSFREVDDNTFLIISAGLWGFPDFGKGSPRISEPVNDPADKIVYGMHSYAPHNYTHQGVGNRPGNLQYPGMLKMFNTSELKYWDRNELQNYIQPAIDFMKKYDVKMIDTEFSVVRNALGADKWLDDRISTYEEFGISWTVFNFGTENWDGWNLTVADNAPFGSVPDGGAETERLKVVKKYLKKNTEFND